MKIQLASDLHLEFLAPGRSAVRLIEPNPDASVLVLAGDVANGTQGIELFKDWPVPVVYIAGNHEFYGHGLEKLRADLRAAARGTAIHFLDDESAVVEGVRFIGSTLWTDYRRRHFSQSHQMAAALGGLADHSRIRTEEGLFTPGFALRQHQASRRWLAAELVKPFPGKTVVVTHHAPHPLSIHRRFAGHPLNSAFVSDLSRLLRAASLWLHGHVHDSFDYRAHGCRVVANPRGYVLSRRGSDNPNDWVFENVAFSRDCLIDLSL